MGHFTENRRPTSVPISQAKPGNAPEELAVIQNILFLIGEFAFVAGSSIALVTALKILKQKKSS